MTLTHLRGLAGNYNLSYNVDARFRSLALETQAVALAVNRSQATVQGDLSHLKTWMQKAQRRSRKLDSRLLALDAALSHRDRQLAQAGKEREAQRNALAGLGLTLRGLQDTVARLTHLVQSQGTRLAALERRLQVARPGTVAPGPPPTQPGLPNSGSPEPQTGRQALRAQPEPGDPPPDFASRLQGTREPPGPGSRPARPPETQGESKYRSPPFPLWVSPPPSRASLGLWSPELCGEITGFTVARLAGKKGTAQGPVCLRVPAAWTSGECAHRTGVPPRGQ